MIQIKAQDQQETKAETFLDTIQTILNRIKHLETRF